MDKMEGFFMILTMSGLEKRWIFFIFLVQF